MSDTIMVSFKPFMAGSFYVFPDITIAVDGAEIIIHTTMPDNLARREYGYSGHIKELDDFVAKYLAPLFRDEYKWEYERDVALRLTEIYGSRSLLKE